MQRAIGALGSAFWALFYVQNLMHIVRLSWRGPATAPATVAKLPAPPLRVSMALHEAAAGTR